ncbi:DUF1360 domain-containing protein [Mycobacterium paraterrae]|uniref:DUF1360 domain-containing protein n=1 Tax=Mycobacterium paraterrae TaxID=577492 RepID=A0ABY3VEY5_9MYCO|nr:DUF1360 domain-containing protein [Mycobacterium paraterrae]UMB67989.1 DUF1360 domain-containing protein [Mycobacterium paraterrae]
MANTQQLAGDIARRARREADAYRGDHTRPLGGYVAVMSTYISIVALAGIGTVATGRTLPDGWRPQDLFTVAVGAHKLSRTITKDAVTSPLRAPFAHYEGTAGPAEVHEETRDSSQLRHSLGELLTCPFCLDVWIATGFVIGLIFAPRLTRLIAGSFTALAGADFLQLAYAKAQQSAEG